MPVRDTYFAPFRLDAEGGRLWNGGRELAIRPKTLAVLRHLVANPGRLVTSAELVHAVWADSHGSAPLVKGCVREVRRLLGDDAAAPRYVATVGRRGYRFIAPVEDVARTRAAAWALDGGDAPFVGRRAELEYLDACLDAAAAGARQMLFVGGEPGIGKTTLVGRFLAAAVDRRGLAVARGQCVEHYGAGEPYLPVLQALAALCRDAGGERALAVLDRHAPTWLAQMPQLLPAAERARLGDRVAGTHRDRMLREMCDAIQALAAEPPLVLWLDDVHWSDPSTVDLISSLAIRRERARVLVIATYRPADVVVSGHPLGPARRALLASGHARDLALGALGGADVASFLARRFPRGALPTALGAMLVDVTDGNPLFLRAVVDELVAQRRLVEEEGCWRLQGRVDELGDVLPENLRHLIERQVERLGDDDQRILEAGSVAGRAFAAGAVAAALDLDGDAVDERLQALAGSAGLVEPRGLDSPPHRATSGRHHFVHALHRRGLYGRLAPARRARLHRRLGEAQEAAWGDRSDEIAAELALHFDRGGDAARAIRFLRVAAENAGRRLADAEVIAHVTRALELVPHLPRRAQAVEELRLQIALALVLTTNRGDAAPEVERTYRRAVDLCARVESRPELYPMLRGLQRLTLVRADVARAMTLARKGVAMARKSGASEDLLEAHLALGVTCLYAGQLARARAALTRALRVPRPADRWPLAAWMQDPAVAARAHLAVLAWLAGTEPAMRAQLAAMEREADGIGHPFSRAFARASTASALQMTGDAAGVRDAADELLALSTAHGFSLLVARGRCLRGWAIAVGDGDARGIDEIRAGLEQWRASGAKYLVAYHLGLLADAERVLGRHGEALRTVEDALAMVRRTGERWWQPELLRLAGEIRGALAARTRGIASARNRRAGLAALRQAAALARRQGARGCAERARASAEQLRSASAGAGRARRRRAPRRRARA
jgi:DNA-binding winged helix-turn-helix (wHTH) protein/predicted ATPase